MCEPFRVHDRRERKLTQGHRGKEMEHHSLELGRGKRREARVNPESKRTTAEREENGGTAALDTVPIGFLASLASDSAHLDQILVLPNDAAPEPAMQSKGPCTVYRPCVRVAKGQFVRAAVGGSAAERDGLRARAMIGVPGEPRDDLAGAGRGRLNDVAYALVLRSMLTSSTDDARRRSSCGRV